MIWLLNWHTYLRAHPKRDWPDVLGRRVIPAWLIDLERWLDRLVAEGRQMHADMDVALKALEGTPK